jgi:Domain of unknown function (DUF1707)
MEEMHTMESVPRRYASGDLRVSDADRDQAVAELSEHFQAGRLTADELDERIGLALRARTGNELACVLADLPAAPTASALPSGDGPAGGGPTAPRAARTALPGWMVAVACVSLVLTVASGFGHDVLIPWWLIPIAVICVRCRARAGRQVRSSARPRTGGGR